MEGETIEVKCLGYHNRVKEGRVFLSGHRYKLSSKLAEELMTDFPERFQFYVPRPAKPKVIKETKRDTSAQSEG